MQRGKKSGGVERSWGGCIKQSKGPWIVRKKGTMIRFRFPTDAQRQQNKERERSRRAFATKIFQGLGVHGNYNLSENGSRNELLKCLCEEAGWHVQEDGTISKTTNSSSCSSLLAMEINHQELEEEDNHIETDLKLSIS